MNYLALSIGSVASIIGLTIIALTIIFMSENRSKAILTGLVFVFLGALIIWLGFQGNRNFQINIGFSDTQFGFLLVGFVMSLFIIKGVLDIREGSKNLQDKTISTSLAFKSKFQIIVAVIMTAFIILISLVAFTQFGR
jgi:hypothetical protein